MVEKNLLDQIYHDFVPNLQAKLTLGILLFGSYATDQQTNRSDIDICIVAPNIDNHELFLYIMSKIDVKSKKYDVRMFLELPIHIKIHIIEKGILIYRDFDSNSLTQSSIFEKISFLLLTNIDFYNASVYHMIGILRDLFTPVFAIS